MTLIGPGEIRRARRVQVGPVDINVPAWIASDQVTGLDLLRPPRTGVILLLAVIAVLLLGIVATKDHAMTVLTSLPARLTPLDRHDRRPDGPRYSIPPDGRGRAGSGTLTVMGTGAATLGLMEIMPALEAALTALNAAGADPAYRVGGTGAALLQGVRLPVGDLDLLVARRKDVDAFAAALSSFPCLYTPSWIPESAQYFARYEVDGVHVEISTVEKETDSDAMECIGRGPWQHYVLIACGPYRVPAVRLELRLATELLRDRPDRYEPLLDHLAAHGYDADLLDRAMTGCALPAERRRLAHDRLDGRPALGSTDLGANRQSETPASEHLTTTSEAERADGSPVRIGGPVPLTPPGWAQAEQHLLAVREVIDSGGIGGRPLELLAHDTAADPLASGPPAPAARGTTGHTLGPAS